VTVSGTTIAMRGAKPSRRSARTSSKSVERQGAVAERVRRRDERHGEVLLGPRPQGDHRLERRDTASGDDDAERSAGVQRGERHASTMPRAVELVIRVGHGLPLRQTTGARGAP
jgi:hypothetical protein